MNDFLFLINEIIGYVLKIGIKIRDNASFSITYPNSCMDKFHAKLVSLKLCLRTILTQLYLSM